jgi:hypothetical protein
LTYPSYTFKKGMRLVRKKSLMAMRDKIRLHTRQSQATIDSVARFVRLG